MIETYWEVRIAHSGGYAAFQRNTRKEARELMRDFKKNKPYPKMNIFHVKKFDLYGGVSSTFGTKKR